MSTSQPPESSFDFTSLAAALAGQYELEREIGRGGMGIVYVGRDLRLDRRVAIKTLPPHLAHDPIVRERFLREARTAGSLSHPNIVPIHRADEIGGHVFFVMGYVDGDSLAQRIRQLGQLDPREVVRQLCDVSDALAYAHGHGIIHRDVKAENILIDAGGRALVTDFGIARLAEAAPLTATGQILGTVYYLSPEQVSGDPVDARSDIYSLGVVGFLALSGRFPFDAAIASAVLIAHVNKAPPPLHTVAPQTPRVLADIIDRCLMKDAADRFQNCDELMDAISAATSVVDREVAERPVTAAAAKAPLVSDTEAHEILSRAADLQAVTGIQSPPPASSQTRRRDATRTSGYRVDELRDAAVEAGIPAKYVDRAMAEHGIGESARPPVVIDHTLRPGWNSILGSPTQLQFELVVDGEMSEDDFDLLIDVIRAELAEGGALGAVGRSFTWQSHPGKRSTQVSVFPRNGRTTIRVSESLRNVAGAAFGGLMGGVGGGSMGIWGGVGAAVGSIGFAAVMWSGTLAVAYVTARGIFGTVSARREKALRKLVERLGITVQESIAASRRKLPTPTRPRIR
ncbi:MAG TPA: serine/threonine-protein kinase [Gemmatimonadaceae bacterium]|nr:serine/threonine-protein kinase [Gemmatimonadaceae bacterium]